MKFFTKIIIITVGVFLIVASVQAQMNFTGEKITYSIKKMGVGVGTTVTEYHGPATFEGKSAVLITVNISALNFKDDEEIYADPQTLYPIAVKRDLNLWGKKEQIIERYDQIKGEVVIDKQAGDKNEQIILTKTGPIDNLYCFIYRYRKEGQLVMDERLKMNLPTKDVDVSVRNKDVIKINKEKVQTYRLQSDSKEYEMWFTDNLDRVPVRIDGAVGIGKTAMIMDSYQAPSN